MSGGVQGVQLLDGGYAFSKQEAVSGSSYQEYSIARVTAELRYNVYECCPGQPWPSVVYALTMARTSSYYILIIIYPGILITLLSFAVFWTSTESSDSLEYGIGVIVVNLLSHIILVGLLPKCGETLWVEYALACRQHPNTHGRLPHLYVRPRTIVSRPVWSSIFASVNTFFCCLSLFQSAFNIMLENLEQEHLLPLWIVMPASAAARWIQRVRNPAQIRPIHRSVPDGALASRAERQMILSGTAIILESVAGALVHYDHFRHLRCLL